MKRKIFLMGMIVLLVGFSLPCLALDSVILRTDWTRYGMHAPFFLGVEKGFYKEVGIDLKILDGKGSAVTVKLIGSGDEAFGLASLAAMAEAVAKGVPVKSIYVETHDSDYGILALKESGITKPKDLVGKSIGVSPGGTSRAVLPAFLRANGIEMNQVKEVAFEGAARFNAILMKKVDSSLCLISMTIPILEKLDPAAQINIIKLSDWKLSILGMGLIANNKLIAANPDLIKRFLKATDRSFAYTLANADEAINALSKDYIQPEPKLWAKDWKLTVGALQSKYTSGKPFGWQPKEEWEQTKDFLTRYVDKKVGEIPLDKLYTNDFISQ